LPTRLLDFSPLSSREERKQSNPQAIERDWQTWLATLFPDAIRDLAPHHEAILDWVWAMRPDLRPAPLVAIIARGGAKSTMAELAAVAVGARRIRAYGLYVCGTQEQADDHVANVAALLESSILATYYPALTERAVGKFGNIKGWRRNRLRTASGFTLDALGLDTAARGIKVDDDRPGFIIIDDIDGENDTPLTTEKRIRALTKKVLPAGAQNLAVLAVQNLVHPDSVFAQLADGRADFLADREMIGPIPAVRDLTYEARDGRWIITGGTPTWAGQDLARCQEMVNDFGLEAFLSECQHDVDVLSGGYFQREWFPIVDAAPAGARTVRFWDKAGTAPNRANPDPDWTRGARVSITADRRIYIEDIASIRADPGGVEALIAQTAALDGTRVLIRIEQEPGSSGKDVIYHYVKNVLSGYNVEGIRSTGSKEERAAPVSSQAKVGNIRLVRGAWNGDFLAEAIRFPLGKHDDQVDAVSGALAFLAPAQPYRGSVVGKKPQLTVR
jgi:predicted phage terminase large subunit-like protein